MQACCVETVTNYMLDGQVILEVLLRTLYSSLTWFEAFCKQLLHSLTTFCRLVKLT